MKADPSVNVTIEAFIGYNLGAGFGLLPTGRTNDVYNRTHYITINGVSNNHSAGQLMDARAGVVAAYLVSKGVKPSRIKLSRGGAYYGSESRKVEFYFKK